MIGRHLQHFFTPHSSNNHRAKALHYEALLLYIAVFVVVNLLLHTGPKMFPDVLGYATDITTEQLLSTTNEKRSQAGLAALTLNPKLSQAAAGKAQDMFNKGYWAHVSPEGRTPWEFIVGAGYSYKVAGENLAKNFSTSQAVVDAWMASPSHKENVLKATYSEIGFAVVNGVLNGEETTLVVQMFGTPVSQVASAPKQPSIVREVSAQEPTAVPISDPTPTVMTVPAAVVSEAPPAMPIEVPEDTRVTAINSPAEAKPLIPYLVAAYKQPAFNVPTVARQVTIAFAGILISILVLDAWLVARRKTVRVTGRAVAHIFFLLSIILGISGILAGSIL